MINAYQIDMSPWEFIRFEDNEEELLKFKEAIKALKIEISEEDEKIWDEFIKYRYHNNEE